MIQGLMHVLNKIKSQLNDIYEDYPDLYTNADDDLGVTTLLDLQEWIQKEIDREIDAMSEHHSKTESQKELAERKESPNIVST